MRRFPRLFPAALLRGICRGEGASCVSSSLEGPHWRCSTWRRPPLSLHAPRFFGDDAGTPSTSTALPKPPPPPTPRDLNRGARRRRRSSSSRTAATATATETETATEKKRKDRSYKARREKKAKLDPAVLEAIAHTQRNSVGRALALLADPPAHIPLEHLTLAGNSLISALGRCGRPHEALRALERLAELGAPFDAFTAAAAVSACSRAASGVGTLPLRWAERGRAIYRGYVEAAKAAAAAAAAEEGEAEEAAAAAAAAAEEEEAEEAAAETTTTTATKKTTPRRERRPIRDRPLLRALLDCGARSNDPEAVWAALDEYDLAGIRPGPSELASLVNSHARRSGVGPRGGVESAGSGGDGGSGGGGGGGEEETDNLGGRGAASKARAAARVFLERYGDRYDPNFSSSRSMREGEDSSFSPSSESISMMTPSVYNALLRAHARAGDLDGAYAVRRAMISAGVAPDSGTCRALSECFGEKNIELAADLVEAADAERVEFLLSRGADETSSPADAASALLRYRPRETLAFPPALLPPAYLKQSEWSLCPALEADEAAVAACRRGGPRLPFARRLPPPFVLDLHGMSRPAARVVLLVSLRRIVAAAAEPGRDKGGVWSMLTKRRRASGGASEGGSAVPGGLVLIVGRSSGIASSRAEEAAEEEVAKGRKRQRQRRRRARARGRSGGSEEGARSASGDGDDDDGAAAARAAARAASRAAHLGVDGGINASVLSFATEHLGLPAALDPRNAGRVVVAAADLDLWVLGELERRRRGATAELAGKQAAAVAAVASSAFGFWWIVPKLLAI